MGGGVDKHIVFVGTVDEYRYKVIKQFITLCKSRKISYEMHFYRAERFDIIADSDIHYGEIPYEENVQCIVNSNCILEIVRENFIGFTQRYYEAIIFNKKLLTNNQEIKEMPYYDERFIQYFENIEDIDWEWVREKVEVDYHYQGDFAPERWRSRMLELIESQ